MASPDDVATDRFRDLTDVKVVLIAGVYIVTLTLPLEYDAGIEMPFIYRFSLLAPYFACVFSRDVALFARTWMALVAVATLGMLGFFVF